jgi:hypothetical protein
MEVWFGDEASCDPANIEAALLAVMRNTGTPAMDGITVRRLPSVLRARWREIEDQLLRGCYQPQRFVGCKSRSQPAEHATSAFQP